MSDGNDDNWEMPKPVFRSSSGALPKSFEETINQSFSPDSDTVEIDEDDDILSVMDPSDAEDDERLAVPGDEQASAQPRVRALPATPQPKRAGSRSFLGIFLLIAILAAAIVAGLYYYFTSLKGTDGNF